jgi:hypothetical protein
MVQVMLPKAPEQKMILGMFRAYGALLRHLGQLLDVACAATLREGSPALQLECDLQDYIATLEARKKLEVTEEEKRKVSGLIKVN